MEEVSHIAFDKKLHKVFDLYWPGFSYLYSNASVKKSKANTFNFGLRFQSSDNWRNFLVGRLKSLS